MGKLVLAAGTKRAIHVWTAKLMERMKDNKGQMIWLVRSSKYNYKKALVCRRVEFNGRCSGEDIFDTPLPGTGGRGVAILFTSCEITVYYDGEKPQYVDMDDDKKPEPAPVPQRRPRVVNRRAVLAG